jgi:hypothetical protein
LAPAAQLNSQDALIQSGVPFLLAPDSIWNPPSHLLPNGKWSPPPFAAVTTQGGPSELTQTLAAQLNAANTLQKGAPIILPINDAKLIACAHGSKRMECEIAFQWGDMIVAENVLITNGKSIDLAKTFPIPKLSDVLIHDCAASGTGLVKCQIDWIVQGPDYSSSYDGWAACVGWQMIRDGKHHEIVFKGRSLQTVMGTLTNPKAPGPVYVGIEALRKAAPTLIDTLPITTR